MDWSGQEQLPDTGIYYPGQDLEPRTMTGVSGEIVSFSSGSGTGTLDMSTDTFSRASLSG
jgi:hypothetical protein